MSFVIQDAMAIGLARSAKKDVRRGASAQEKSFPHLRVDRALVLPQNSGESAFLIYSCREATRIYQIKSNFLSI